MGAHEKRTDLRTHPLRSLVDEEKSSKNVPKEMSLYLIQNRCAVTTISMITNR